MGPSLANEVLMLGRKLNATEALECGFVSSLFPDALLEDATVERATHLAACPPGAVQAAKKLARDAQRDELYRAMHAEISLLRRLWASPEAIEAVVGFLSRKKDAKAKL